MPPRLTLSTQPSSSVPATETSFIRFDRLTRAPSDLRIAWAFGDGGVDGGGVRSLVLKRLPKHILATAVRAGDLLGERGPPSSTVREQTTETRA